MSNCIYDENYICKNCKKSWPGLKNALPENCINICLAFKKPNKALNLTKAIAKFVLTSIWKRELQYVNPNQYKERLDFCNSCNYRHPEKPECAICGCKLTAIFNKAQLKTERCPLGKWPIIYDIDSIQVSK